MAEYNHISKGDMAYMNKRSIFKCIYDNGAIIRTELADRLGLSITAVVDITGQLIEHGMVAAELRKGGGKGKRPEVLSIRGDKFRFIGVDIGRMTTRMVLVGLDQKVIASAKYHTENVEDADVFIKCLCERIILLISESKIDASTIIGICVAMPGLIERATGNVIFSPNFGWEDVPLQAKMNAQLPYQVIVENANRVQANWEVFRNPENERLTVLCIGIGYGIGGGLLQQGRLYYGSSGTSGEVGHLPVSTDPEAVCSCGGVGCLEAVASGAALAAKGKQLAAEGGSTFLLRLCENDIEKIDAKMVFEAAHNGDAKCAQLIDQTASYIATALAVCINILDPDRIYLCGGMMKNGPTFLEKIKKYTRQRQMHYAGRSVSILSGDPDDWNVARAAARVIPYYEWNHESLSFMR